MIDYIKTLLTVLVLLINIDSVGASNNEIYFSFIKSGKINTFSNEYEKIEVDFDGEIIWSINQSGFTFDSRCGNETSEFKGKISQDKINKLSKIALKSINSQKKVDLDAPLGKGRSLTKRIKLLLKDESHSAVVSDQTKETDALYQYLDELTNNLNPSSILRINARIINKDELEVMFKYFGKGPYSLLIPKRAADAFHIANHKIKYKNKIPKEIVKLSYQKRVFNLNLKIERLGGDKKIQYLKYSNKLALHHAKDDFSKGEFRPTSANLCTNILSE